MCFSPFLRGSIEKLHPMSRLSLPILHFKDFGNQIAGRRQKFFPTVHIQRKSVEDRCSMQPHKFSRNSNSLMLHQIYTSFFGFSKFPPTLVFSVSFFAFIFLLFLLFYTCTQTTHSLTLQRRCRLGLQRPPNCGTRLRSDPG